MTKKYERIGGISVDAGLVWIGDPCYILHAEKLPESVGKNWQDFCNKLGDNYPTKVEFEHGHGIPGLGVCVSSGYGDGFYDVEAVVKDGRIKEVRVKFF